MGPGRRSPFVATLLAGALLTGCATPPQDAPDADSLATALARGDRAFALSALPQVDPKALFALPPDLQAQLDRERQHSASQQRRLAVLLDVLFGADRRGFAYGAAGTTAAAQTWAAKRGDCLSLTILAYSAARAMGLDAQMQEVRVPALYERRPGVEFVNRHVNVALQLRADLFRDILTKVAILDFEPLLSGGELGRPLDEAGMLARFQNNLGGEALAAGERRKAYAHYRAAMAADPQYAVAHSNLAVLLAQDGLMGEAEVLLRHAAAVDPSPAVALGALHRLLLDQHRDGEAQRVAQRLQAVQDADPYHWIAKGIQDLDEGRNKQAVAALEHAQQLTIGFTEVHGWLALAYWRMGDDRKARQQLAQLDAIKGGSPLADKLRKKIAGVLDH